MRQLFLLPLLIFIIASTTSLSSLVNGAKSRTLNTDSRSPKIPANTPSVSTFSTNFKPNANTYGYAPSEVDWTEALLDGSQTIDDCKCDVASVRDANTNQLHAILNELLNTTYFRLFRVPKDGICPLSGKKAGGVIEAEKVVESVDKEKNKSKKFDEGDDNGNEGNMNGKGEGEEMADEPEDEAKCGGVFGENFGPLYDNGLFGSGSNEMSSLKGEDLSKDSGKLGKSKCELVAVDPESVEMLEALDHTITGQENFALESSADLDLDCDDESKPSFWLNICVNLEGGVEDANDENLSANEFVNLQKNIEHYTGYNGSKIWKAIYHENCFKSRSEQDMCLEERVLYRLTSGLHASINTHIALNFYDSFQSGSAQLQSKREFDDVKFAPNAERFVRVVASHPERVQNLYFTFAFLLRAVKKAETVLRSFNYAVGNQAEEERINHLMRHLLHSDVIKSCDSVFKAFDEKLLFQESTFYNDLNNAGLNRTESINEVKRNFKDIFFKISNIFNCVKCERCKLHGKMQLLGIGTALKILLIEENSHLLKISREELVALINTLGKLSESIESIPHLVKLYWRSTSGNQDYTSTHNSEMDLDDAEDRRYPDNREDSDLFELKRSAMRATGLAKVNQIIPSGSEEILISKILDGDINLLLLAEYFQITSDYKQFASQALDRLNLDVIDSEYSDAIIIGSGLSGLTAALTILDRGGRVILIEKMNFFGGNSARASSGINGIYEEGKMGNEYGDSYAMYKHDITESGDEKVDGKRTRENSEWIQKVNILVEGSSDALKFVRDRVKLDISTVGQLGGHSKPRTYRPKSGLAGAELISKLVKEVMEYEKTGRLVFYKNTKVVELLVERNSNFDSDVSVFGVLSQNLNTMEIYPLHATNVVIATGGYAFVADENEWIRKYRPDLSKLKSTNGKFSVGDGIGLVENNEIFHAKLIDMDKVQVHPTGFLNIEDLLSGSSSTKVSDTSESLKLCAEILRGVGGILLDVDGNRFVDELQTRDFIADTMQRYYLGKNYRFDSPIFYILLNKKAADEVQGHVSMYMKKGLLIKFDDLETMAKRTKMSYDKLIMNLMLYDKAAVSNSSIPDAFKKKSFNNAPFLSIESGPYYIGAVTPVVHYSMGGIKINNQAKVIIDNPNKDDETERVVSNLYAIGEVVGGIHGKNRLGGNALTECVVFGRLVGNSISISHDGKQYNKREFMRDRSSLISETELQMVSMAEVSLHSTESDCWVVLNKEVYDLTSFMDEHPAGKEPILVLCGKDGTEDFEEVHSYELLKNYSFKPLAKILS